MAQSSLQRTPAGAAERSTWASSMRQNTKFLLIAMPIHFLASFAAFLWSYTVTSNAFDGRQIAWLSAHLAHRLYAILWFPLEPIIDLSHSSLWFYAVLIMNSLLWSASILLIYRLLTRHLPRLRS